MRADEVTLHRRRAPTPSTAACSGCVRAATRGAAWCTARSSTPRCCTRWRGPARAVDAAGATELRPGRRSAPPRGRGAGRAVVAAADGQPRGRHRPAGRELPQLPRTASRSSSTPARRRAGCRCPTAGPPPAGSAHKWGGPAGVGVLLVRKGARWRNPFPADDRIDERGAGLRERAGRARGRGRPAGRGGRARRDRRPPARAGRPDPAARSPRPRHRGRRRPGRPAPPPGDLLLPLRRRRGAGHRARPRTASGSPAARPAPPPRSSPATCWRRWAR